MRAVALAGFAALVGLAAPVARAIEDRADVEPNQPVSAERPIAFKLTLGGWHDVDASSTATDVNLRLNTARDAAWLGVYDDRQGYRQTRVGHEHQFDAPFGRLITSLQLASGGFVGGSLTAEVAPDAWGPYVALVGWGRTNLQPYFNLNFDPNDSVLLGGAWKPDEHRAITLFQVRDDRLDTAQRVTHLVIRDARDRRLAWSLDVFHRAGWADATRDGNPVHHWGAGLQVDHRHLFARVVWDPRANFAPGPMVRLSAGLRF